MPPPFLAAFTPDPGPLIKIINQHVDDDMLCEIAAADYGSDFEQHLVLLRIYRDGGTLPVPLLWHAGEVLELIRWSQPDDPTCKPSGRGENGHWMRAFACVALLSAGTSRDSVVIRNFMTTNLPILLLSLVRLPARFGEAPTQYIACLLENLGEDEPSDLRALCCIALLWCTLKYLPATSDKTLIVMCEWISAEERAAADIVRKCSPASTQLPLLDTTFQPESWQSIGRQLETIDLQGRSDEAQTWVRGVAAMLVQSDD
jgi:hypothetical protein